MNSGSLYYFFKTKEDLLLAVLDLYLEKLRPWVVDPIFERVSDPIERVFALLDGYRMMLTMTGYKQGCPIGNLAIEMSEKSEGARDKIAQNFVNWCKVIEECLSAAGARLPESVNRPQLATFILTVMEGAVMQARAFRSLAPYDQSISMLKQLFDRLLAEKSGAGNTAVAKTPL